LSVAESWRMTRNNLEGGRVTSFGAHSHYRHPDIEYDRAYIIQDQHLKQSRLRPNQLVVFIDCF